MVHEKQVIYAGATKVPTCTCFYMLKRNSMMYFEKKEMFKNFKFCNTVWKGLIMRGIISSLEEIKMSGIYFILFDRIFLLFV